MGRDRDQTLFRQLRHGTVALLALSALACSSLPASPSGRKGFFDRVTSAHRAPGNASVSAGSEMGEEGAIEVQIPAGARLFRWPLENVQVTSPFGKRNDGFHEGIDLRAKIGTPVYAAAAGRVLYADKRIGGYGRMVVVRHPGGLTTVYAHNSRLLVRKGQRVKKGQKIAISGTTGRSTGPHLHFEVRSGVAAVDPLRLMPPVLTTHAVTQEPAPKVHPKLNPKLKKASVSTKSLTGTAKPRRTVALREP